MTELEKLKPELKRSMSRAGYDSLMPVQQKVIPLFLQKKNLFVQSKTGSGKTAAYLIPIMQMLKQNQEKCQALILTPTRELALQVKKSAELLGADLHVRTAAITGGMDEKKQINVLRLKPQIVVGTAGRLLDFIRTGKTDFSALRFLVLDEADQLMAMGQQKEAEEILQSLPKCQTALFSATLDDSMASFFPGDFATVEMDSPAEVNDQIQTYWMLCRNKNKDLKELLKHLPIDTAILFMNHIQDSLRMEEELQKQNILASSFSSHFDQKKRLRILDAFKKGKIRILIATDAAARGLDLSRVSHIIHYDLPMDAETYIHRSGRTAHQGNTGISIAMMNDEEKQTETGQYIIAHASPFMMSSQKGSDLSIALKQKTGKDTGILTLVIRAGRQDKIRVKDLIGALCTVIPFEKIGTVEVQDRFSTAVILDDPAARKLSSLSIKGKKRRVERKRNEAQTD